MVLRIIDDDLRLPYLDRYGGEEYPLAYGEQFGILKFRSLEGPVPEGEHQVVCHSVQEDAQAVCVEAVAGESVALHPFLEMPYVQFVLAPLAVGSLVECAGIGAADVAHDESDVGLSAHLGHLHLDHHPLRKRPRSCFVPELAVFAGGMPEQLVVMSYLIRELPDYRLGHQDAVGCKAGDEEQLALQCQAHPVHQLVGAEMAVAADGDRGIGPCGTYGGDKPLERVEDVGRLVPAAGLQQRQYEPSAVALEHHQRHKAETVVVGIEDGLFLLAVGVDVGIVAVEDDVAWSLLVGEDEHRDEKLLDTYKVLIGDHVLEAAHRRGGTDVPVTGIAVHGQLHHRLLTVTVAVVHVLVAQAYLEDARQDEVFEGVADKPLLASVNNTRCQLIGY